jgi:hypothetical protein
MLGVSTTNYFWQALLPKQWVCEITGMINLGQGTDKAKLITLNPSSALQWNQFEKTGINKTRTHRRFWFAQNRPPSTIYLPIVKEYKVFPPVISLQDTMFFSTIWDLFSLTNPVMACFFLSYSIIWFNLKSLAVL